MARRSKPSGATLGRDDILRLPRLRFETVEIGGMGLVNLRELPASERLAFLDQFRDATDTDSTSAGLRRSLVLAVGSLCDSEGHPLFPNGDGGQAVDAILARSMSAVSDLLREVFRVNGMEPGAAKEAAADFTGDPSS